MNVAKGTSSPVLKRFTSPRQPAVREEVKKIHEKFKNWNTDCHSKTDCTELADQPSCTNNVVETKDCTEKSSNTSPVLKWAQSLQCLLEDLQGISLFQKFLEQEGQDSCLSFWLACNGVKKCDPNDWRNLSKLIKVIYAKKVKKISVISDKTKKEIKQKVQNAVVDITIFDKARQEVEVYMMKTTYPNFLRSDLYIKHLREWQQNELSPEKEREVTPELVEQKLPTVLEDFELRISSSNKPHTKTNLLQRNKSPYISKFKTEAPSGLLRSPYRNYSSYTKYDAFLPVSAQSSELQSSSSGVQTDDTMSLTDGSNVDYRTHSQSNHKQPQKVMKHLNNPICNPKDSEDIITLENFIPRTNRIPEIKQLSPAEFHAALVKALNKVVEERKKMEKFNEKLRSVESPELSRPSEYSFLPMASSNAAAHQYQKGNTSNVFDPAGFLACPEENDQDILDQHIARVFDSGQRTPAQGLLYPVVPCPLSDLEKSHVPMQGSGEHVEYPSKHNIKYRRDHDTHSIDSTVCQSDENLPIDCSRRWKEHPKRYVSKKFSSVTDSSSSCDDRGINCESGPGYSNSSQKTGYNSCHVGSQDAGYSQWACAPVEQYSHDFSGKEFSAPDTTSSLPEFRRRLEDENRAKMRMKKPTRKSPLFSEVDSNSSSANDVTVICYSYDHLAVPYRSKLPGKNITLRQFKSVLSKKGNFRYFFKTTGVEFEEVTEDSKVLPLWEGKVFCVIETMDNRVIV